MLLILQNRRYRLLFTVSAVKAINLIGFLLEIRVILVVKGVVFGINLALEDSVFALHGTSCFKLGSVAQDDLDFVVVRVNSFLHGNQSYQFCNASIVYQVQLTLLYSLLKYGEMLRYAIDSDRLLLRLHSVSQCPRLDPGLFKFFFRD